MKTNKSGTQKSIERLQKEHLETTIMQAMIFIPATFYFCLHFGYARDQLGKRADLADVFEKITSNISSPLCVFQIDNYNNFGSAFALAGATALLVGLIILAYYFYDKSRIHHDMKVGKGSTVWANPRELTQKFGDIINPKKPASVKEGSNLILSKNFYVSNDTKKHGRALNVLVLGASGSGKTRYLLKPNLLQMDTSYVITDPKGEILESCGEALRRNGYKIKVLDVASLTSKKDNLDNLELRCDSYNPMKYCTQESDIKKLVKAFITNTDSSNGQGKGDPFWDDSMNEFLCSCVAFLTTCPKGSNTPYAQIPEVTGGLLYEACFANLCELTRLANSKWTPDCGIELMEGVKLGDGKNNTANASKLAAIFENMRQYEANRQGLSDTPDLIEKPYALREWENFRIAPEKTSTTILMVVAVRLGPFNIEQMRDLTSTDTLNLQDFAKEKTALFLQMSATDKTYNFLLSFVYTQLFDILYQFGERQMDGSKMLKTSSGEFVKFYSDKEVQAGIDEDVNKVKNVHIVHNTSRPDQRGKIKQKKKVLGMFDKTITVPVTIHDDWYEIYDEDDRLITMRPTKAAADKFVSELKNGHLENGRAPRLPIHVRMLIDEFPNIGEIPEYKEKLSTVRGYDISCVTICQTLTQLKGMYEKDYEVLDANSPFTVFLGGDENTNNEYISKKIGASTIKTYNQSLDSKKGGSQSYQYDTRELLKPEEIGRINYTQEIVLTYGEMPLLDDKCDYTTHPNYKYTHDYAEDAGCLSALMFDREIYPVLSTPNLTKRAEIRSAIPEVKPITADTFTTFFGVKTNDEALTKAEESFFNFNIEDSVATAF